MQGLMVRDGLALIPDISVISENSKELARITT
jgi:hypothetical protein